MMFSRTRDGPLPGAVVAFSLLMASAGVLAEQAVAQSTSQVADPVVDFQDLVHALRDGGYVVYFRHAATEAIVEQWDELDLSDCATQRNLSETGREQARAIGTAFATFDIKVAKVLSSPFCRAVETSELAFGKAEISDDLYFSVFAEEDKFQHRSMALRGWLATPPPAGTNVVLVSHQHNLEDAVGLSLETEGAAAVFRPNGDGTFILLTVVPPEQWAEHAEPPRDLGGSS
jgi:phosphohistidine phosphatase SixA